jgi:hypothetical protein
MKNYNKLFEKVLREANENSLDTALETLSRDFRELSSILLKFLSGKNDIEGIRVMESIEGEQLLADLETIINRIERDTATVEQLLNDHQPINDIQVAHSNLFDLAMTTLNERDQMNIYSRGNFAEKEKDAVVATYTAMHNSLRCLNEAIVRYRDDVDQRLPTINDVLTEAKNQRDSGNFQV